MSDKDNERKIDKIKEYLKDHAPSHRRSGVGMDGFQDSDGRSSDSGDAPSLESKPSNPLRRGKPKKSGS
ncbi:hypothetical protein [Marinobacter nauticus]|uniref:hypothetical protein n=1 Tax=Marinobacter nauticus TaxID=2743 RepID=UPI001CFD878D|nr:hypothetical protein [Marinobacter nauticus]